MSSFNFIKFLLLAKPIFAQLPISFGLGQLRYMGGEGLQRYHVRDSGTFPWKKLMCGFGTLGQIYLRFIFMITEHCQELLQQICSWYFFSWSLNSIRDYWSRFTHDIFMITEHCQGLLEQIYSWHFHDHWAWSGEQWPVWECDPMVCCVQVCPICAALPGGDPNHVTDDLASHLALEHRTPRDFISFAGLAYCTACCWHGWLYCLLLTWVTVLPVVDMGDCTARCWHGWLNCLLLT